MIHADARDGFTLLTIDRPEVANALDAEHCASIAAAVQDSAARGDRALVLTGVEGRFSAGADFRGVHGDDFRTHHQAMLTGLLEAPMPVIAAVNGPAIGAGMQLALAADLRVVDDDAVFGIPTARLGLAVDPWTIERLASVVGSAVARRVLMLCEHLPATDPALVPLIDRRGDLEVACEMAADLAGMAPLTLRYIKTALDRLAAGEPQSDDAHTSYRAIWASADSREGLTARREGRAPRFGGS